MVLRRALVKAAITFAVLMTLASVGLYAVGSRLPEGGLNLLGGAAVEALTVRPPICLMEDCVETEDASRFCFMQLDRLRDSAADCPRSPVRPRLMQAPAALPSRVPNAWPTRPGAPI